MMNIRMSRPATGLFRGLLARAGEDRDRILLMEWKSLDWQSLTFVGERHKIRLRITGPDSALVARRLTGGIGEADFPVPGQIVADMLVASQPRREPDGSHTLVLEALTIEE